MTSDIEPEQHRRAPWAKQYSGGSADAEYHEFQQLARAIMQVQATVRRRVSRRGVHHPIQRAFHAKATLAVDDAELRFGELPADLRVGFAQPGAAYPTIVRFSNAAGNSESDLAPDLRGIALRVLIDGDTSIDLLATNVPASHARNARQFVEFAKANAGGHISQAVGLARLVRLFGVCETWRMRSNFRTARRRPVSSIATEKYWSCGAVTWGPDRAVRYLLRPTSDTPPASAQSKTDPNYLSAEAAKRLDQGDIRFQLCVQRYVNDQVTPIEDTAAVWKETDSPAEPVAILTIKQAKINSTDAQTRASAIEGLAFNPWNTTGDFCPLGNLNRARKAAYDASATHRAHTRWYTETPLRNVLLFAVPRVIFCVVNRRIDWYRLPLRAAVLNLDALRHVLYARNLFDTEPRESPPQVRDVPPPIPEDVRVARRADGSYNDLSAPKMGAVDSTFGRNLKPVYRPLLFDKPNPFVVSEELLKRKHFVPARSLNLLAAAWIQFQVHDWAHHARYKLGEHGGKYDVKVPLPPREEPWRNTPQGLEETVMRIAGNIPRSVSADGTEQVFANAASHWWDASEVYGSTPELMASLRDGPKIRLDEHGYLPRDRNGMEITGFNEGWWLGLSIIHTLFAREHNAVCDELRANYKRWSDDRVFNTARLIVSALIAKIHAVEWSTTILSTGPTDLGQKANWNGPPPNDWRTRLGTWAFDAQAGVGIPATKPDHHGVPFSLTEDFVSIYRMHPLIPDDYRFADHRTGKTLHTPTFRDITGEKADDMLRPLGFNNAMYSFGIAHPGAITLNNYPESLRSFERNGELIDLAVVDIVRDRRRGVPRYNDFRTGLHKPRLRNWEHWKQLSDDPEVVDRIRDVYRSIDEVDTMIGLFAETPPEGFGFSDTAFRLFIVMASRRLQSDRFLTVDFRPEVYSPLGMDWVQTNTMTSVILRHCPELAALLPRDRSAFAPWRTVTSQQDQR